MLRVDLKQRRRLEEIIHNLGDRIKEARVNGWLGEVQGLQISLEAARNKLVSLDRLARTRNRTRSPWACRSSTDKLEEIRCYRLRNHLGHCPASQVLQTESLQPDERIASS